MDPNACLKKIDDFLAAGRKGDEVDEWCDDLRSWLRKGCFEPNWDAYPRAAAYYGCRAATVRSSSLPTSILNTEAPTPETLAAKSGELYAALVCILADLEVLGHVGPMTCNQALRALKAVHETPREPETWVSHNPDGSVREAY